ncbi:MAG TPA: hypothetical protein PKD18_11000 [Saprospiraceae bacterium]|nr:hypothetical protein [Saprospiraceae bacterium]
MKHKTIIGTIGGGIVGAFLTWFLNKPIAEICARCHELECKQPAEMIFFNKDTICDKLLYLEFNPQQDTMINSEAINECSISSGTLINSSVLIGYYIQPEIELSLNSNQNSLFFFPVWLVEDNIRTTEIIGSPVRVGASYNSIVSSPNSLFVLANPVTGGFNHSIFQFNNLAIDKGFSKAYISRHELLLIANHCEFIGISGATVRTGNIGVFTLESSSALTDFPIIYNEDTLNLKKSCDQEFFTYRFVGMNVVPSVGNIFNPEGQENSRNANGWTKFLPSNILLKSSGVVYNPAIPTETWTTPCPPMWDETGN